jgi:hypothetical protein
MELIKRSEWGARAVPGSAYAPRGDSTTAVIHHTAETLRNEMKMSKARPGVKWYAARYKKNKAVQDVLRAYSLGDSKAYEAECRAMRDHQAYHMNGQGWTDIGYHFVIMPSGRVFEGRPVYARGSHCLNGNHMIGISFAGNYEHDVLTVAQLAAYAELRREYGIKNVVGHYDVPGNSTACPGRNIKSKLGV